MVDLFRYKKWDLVTRRGWYFLLSVAILLVGIAAMVRNYRATGEILNFGIDFKGGGLVTYSVQGARLPITKGPEIIGKIRQALKQEGIENEVQISPAVMSDSKDQILVRTLLVEGEENLNLVFKGQVEKQITPVVTRVVQGYAPGAEVTGWKENREVVTGTVTQELVKNGIGAVIIGSFLIMVWIWLRYNIGGAGLRYSTAAIIALLHDLGMLIGMFGLLHNFLQVNSPFIAALLTVLGYSIHDTIVIFDRIRENLRLRKGRTFAETVNISLLETMARSVNTVLTVLFTLLALFVFGGPTVRDFTAAMLIGVFFGGYSSIFIASQILVQWAKAKDRVLLPVEALAPAGAPAMPAAAVSAPAGAAEVKTPVAAGAAPQGRPSRDAIRRARQAGKSSGKRRR